MKMFQLAILVIASFATGFLFADGLATAPTDLVFVKSQPSDVSTTTEKMKCEITRLESPDRHVQSQTSASKHEKMSSPSISQIQPDIAMTLESYSAQVASQQRPATELILQIEDADFVQMIEQQQQDQQFDAQSERYQLLLSEFFSAYTDVVQQRFLTCSSRFCLLELEVQNSTAWPMVFKTLTAQQWWQSMSYQSAADMVAFSQQQSSQITLLLQHDWVDVVHSDQLAVADGEHLTN
jgi:hypothetical protein